MTKRRKFPRILLALPLLLLPVLVVALPADGETGEGAEATALPVEVLEVRRVDGYPKERSYTGVLRPRRRAELSFEVAGRLLEVGADEGQRVAAGQELARLDTRRLEARRVELRAERARLAAELAEMEAGPRSQEIEAARSELAALEAERELAALQTERRRGLVERDSLSAEELDRFAAQERVVASRADGARARLDELREGTRPERIEAQRARLAAVDASLASLELDLEDSVLRAPFEGRIAARLHDEGAVVAVGRPVLTLVEDRHLEAWVGLPVEAAAALEDGQIELRVGTRRLAGLRPDLLPELDPDTRTLTAVLALGPEDAAELHPGQVARLHVTRRVEREGFWLPLDALTEGSRGLWSCLVVQPEGELARLERADLEVLHLDGERALVRGTLLPGDRVVRSGTHRIGAGQLVVPVSSTQE